MTNKAIWRRTRSERSMEPTVPESELYRSIQAVLPRKSDKDPNCFSKGMLRWTLHEKVQNNPGSSLSLLRLLIKELEKEAQRWDSRQCIIPLLHTLMYAITQTAYIPDELYKRVYDFCKRLLTYPHPYCTVGYGYAKQIKAERSAPGLMYQRMVTGEQRLKSDHYPYQERVFILADPDIFSGSLGEFLLGDIEAYASESDGSPGPVDHMRNVVQHSIQAVLGAEQCHGQKLVDALQDMGQEVEPYFQKVLAVLERSGEEGGRREEGSLRSRLQDIYNEIVADTDSEPLSSGSLYECPLPNPEMSFHLWKEDVDIWKELSSWLRSSSMSEQCSQEQEDFELVESPSHLMVSDMTRLSVMSNDSGIERDLPSSADAPTSSLENPSIDALWEQYKSEPDQSKLSRRGGFKTKPTMKDTMMLMQDVLENPASLAGGGGNGAKGETRGETLQRRAGIGKLQSTFSKKERRFTARIVAVGDDKVLGRLAKEFYFYRKREARRICLTMKINIQFYHIPVSRATTPISSVRETPSNSKGNPCSLGSFLSMVDPWYNTNIKSLGSMIPKLAETQESNPGKLKDPFVSDVISYYVRTSQQSVYFTIYSVKITFTMAKEPVEDVFLTHLEMDFMEFRSISASVKGRPDRRRKSIGEVSGADVLINYRKVTLSGRDNETSFSARISAAQINTIPLNEEEDLNCLTLTLNQSPLRTKNNIVESKIRTNNIKIHTSESRPFIITLDRDSCRTYTDVLCIEIFPCLDPAYCAQKSVRSKFNLGEGKDACLSKYMNKSLSLPVNTFAGITT